MAGEAKSVTLGEIRKSEGDVLYGLVLLFTFGQMALIVWDMLAMLPGFAEMVKPYGLSDPGKIHSIGEITTMYLGLVGVYTGRNAWRTYFGKDDTEAVPQYLCLRIQRGYFYVTLWCTLYFIALMLKAGDVISRMPHELSLTALGVFAALFGDKAIQGFLNKRTVRQLAQSDTASAAASHHDAILAHVDRAGRITNAECQQLTGLSDAHATRVLDQLQQEGKLEQKGVGRGIYYQKKTA